MKLKYYLRGMGIGIILTAIVMGFALGGRSKTMSDAEIISRAKALGMVEGQPSVLSGEPIDEPIDESSSGSESEGDSNDASASDETLDEEGEEVSEEEHQDEPLSDTAVSEVAEEESETEKEDQDRSSDPVETSSETETRPSVINAAGTETDVVTTGTASSEEADSSKTSSGSSAEESTAASDNSAEESAAPSGKYVTSTAHTVTIPGGQGSEQVSQILLRAGVIDDASSFNRYLVDRRIDRIIRSGEKTIPAGADYETIAGIITR